MLPFLGLLREDISSGALCGPFCSGWGPLIFLWSDQLDSNEEIGFHLLLRKAAPIRQRPSPP